MATRISISLPDEMVEDINEQLEYGDSRSKWVREAIELRFQQQQQEQEEGNGHPATTASAD